MTKYKYQPVNYVWYESPSEFSPISNMNSKTIFGLAVVLCSLQGIYGDNVTISSNYTTSSLEFTAIEAYIEAAQAAAGEAMANFTENMNNANANASAILSSGFTSALQYAEAAVAQGRSAAATIEAAIANLTQEINNTVTNSSTYKALEEQKAILDGIAANITTGWATAIQLANSTAAYASKQGVAAVANLFTVGSNLSQTIRNGTEAAIAEGETAFRSAINSTSTIFGDSANDTVSRFVSALSAAVNSGNGTASSIASIFQSGVSAIQARYNNYASSLLASMASQLASAQNVTSTEFAKLVTAFTKLQSVGMDIGSAIVSTIQNDTAAVISEGESIASQVASNIESSISKTFNFGKDIAKVEYKYRLATDCKSEKSSTASRDKQEYSPPGAYTKDHGDCGVRFSTFSRDNRIRGRPTLFAVNMDDAFCGTSIQSSWPSLYNLDFSKVEVDSQTFRINSPQFTRPGSRPGLPIIDSPVYPESQTLGPLKRRVDNQATNNNAGVGGGSVLGNVDFSERGDFTTKLKEGRQVAGEIVSIAAVSLKDMMFRGSKAAKEWASRAREKAEFAAETAFDRLVEFSGYTGDH
uniref:(California timema) hypothetical protein n=1 Tax=Timema californicum TaxID=61474 RepID=A0A7R9J1Y1_TIMCA|nr:unnamed protein product [Timema californicum]